MGRIKDLEKFLDERQLKWWHNLQLNKAQFAAQVMVKQGRFGKGPNTDSTKRRAKNKVARASRRKNRG